MSSAKGWKSLDPWTCEACWESFDPHLAEEEFHDPIIAIDGAKICEGCAEVEPGEVSPYIPWTET
mgnify:CR=1 FL=1